MSTMGYAYAYLLIILLTGFFWEAIAVSHKYMLIPFLYEDAYN